MPAHPCIWMAATPACGNDQTRGEKACPVVLSRITAGASTIGATDYVGDRSNHSVRILWVRSSVGSTAMA